MNYSNRITSKKNEGNNLEYKNKVVYLRQKKNE